MKVKFLKTTLLALFTLLLVSCSKNEDNTAPQIDYPAVGTIILKENVVKLDDESNGTLIQIDTNELRFNESAQISTLKVNDYIVGAPTSLCPTGYLRKVTGITRNGQIFLFNTSSATLDDVIEECNIAEAITNNVFNRNQNTSSVSTSFDVVLFDGDLNTNTENDQAKITGSIALTPKLIFEMKKKRGQRLKAGYIKAGVAFEIEKDFDFVCKTTLTNAEKEVPVGNELRGPAFPLAGGLIWITPTLNFSVGIKGSVSATMSVGTNETSNYTIYKELNQGEFSDIQFEKSYTPTALNLDFTGNAAAEVYFKAKYSMKIYEVIGMNVSSKIYLEGDANVSATELNSVNYCTKWGLKGAAGIALAVFGSDIVSAELETQLYEAPLPQILGVIPCGAITLNAIPNNGLVAFYPFNGNANDESGNSNNGTVNSATLTTDRHGNANKAFQFNGSRIAVANSASLQFTSNSSSWSFWVKLDPSTTAQCIWAKSSDTSGGRLNVFASINPDQTINIWSSGISTNVTLIPNSDYQQWIHIVTLFDGTASQMKTYANGTLIETNSIPFSHTPTNASSLFFGYNDVFSFPWYLSGKLDDIRIYNRLISESEIQSLYNE